MKLFRSVNTAVFVLAIALSLPVTLFLIHNQQDIRQHAATGPVTLEYGFNTHMSATNTGLGITAFTSDIDDLVANKETWVRVSMRDWEIATEDTSSGVAHIIWNQQDLAVYDQAINYAVSKGIKVFLVTSPPGFAQNYSDADYSRITSEYYTFLANRYKGKVVVWQIFNEVNVHDYRTYNPISTVSATYLSKLNSLLSTAGSAIKSIDPTVLITTNAGGFPVGDQLMSSWNMFFDGIRNSIDIISVDFYPNNNTSEIQKLGDRITALNARYGKDVYVAEFGMCTGKGVFTEADQSNYVPQMIQSFQYSPAKVILYYEIRDDNTSDASCDSTFGIKNTSGTKKSSYNPIMATMNNNANPNAPIQNSNGTLRVYTDPAIQATINITPYSFTRQWGVNWESLAVARYFLNFSLTRANASVKFPTQYPILIKAQQTTQVTVNTQTGGAVVQYFPAQTDLNHGLLRVVLSPSVAANITTTAADLSSLSQQWGINWVSMGSGMYTIRFSYPYTTVSGKAIVLPQPQVITVQQGKTTVVDANVITGTLTTNIQ